MGLELALLLFLQEASYSVKIKNLKTVEILMFLSTQSPCIRKGLCFATLIGSERCCLNFLWSVKTGQVSWFLLPQHPEALVSQQSAIRIR